MSIHFKYSKSGSCRKCLQYSLPINMMVQFARLIYPDYNIYQRLGLTEKIPISNQEAAERIVLDMIQGGQYLQFVESLVKIATEGYMGSRYNLLGLYNLVTELIEEGYSFDKESGLFYENQQRSISPNWGRLINGDERRMTILRIDIVDNSELVRKYPKHKVEKAYQDVRNIISRIVVSRIGRIWSWEGDSVLAAFLFGPMQKMAIYAGMEILHELYFYNRLRNPLDSPINIRIGSQIGPVLYYEKELERLKNDTVKQAVFLEALAETNSLCISFNLYINMERNILNLFSDEKINGGCKYRLYTMRKEK